MSGFAVIKPGLLTTVQDRGRTGLAHIGIPNSGFMDSIHADIARRTFGSADAVVLECAIVGPSIRFEVSVNVAISGAMMNPKVNGAAVGNDVSIAVKPGDELELSAAIRGVFSYIAFDRTVDLPEVFGSVSTLVSAGLGGFHGRPLRVGDGIRLGQKVDNDSNASLNEGVAQTSISLPTGSDSIDICATRGPEFGMVGSAFDLEQHLSKPFTVSGRSSRTATILENEPQEPSFAELKSSGVFPGVIQMNREGNLMVLMRDGPTTGGYPRIAVLDEEAICQLAQCPPGVQVRLVFPSAG